MFDDILGSASNLFQQAQDGIGSIAGPYLPFGATTAAKHDPRSLMGEDLTGGGGNFGVATGLCEEAAPYGREGAGYLQDLEIDAF